MALDTNLQSAFTAVGTAVKGKISSTEKGAPNGVATLDGTGKIPSAQLPSYVDDVVEYANLAVFPATGTAGILYVALDTNKQYRWAGSTYQQITSGAVDSVAGKTGVVTLVKADVGLGNVDNTADNVKNVLSATKWTTARTITIGSSGKSLDGSANVSWSLAEIGAQAAGSYQPLDADLTAIAAISGTTGLLKKTVADTWTLDTNAYVTSSGVTSVGGTAPIVSSGGNTPVISINAATTSAPGSMSSEDKTKLDGIATGANVNVTTDLSTNHNASNVVIVSSDGTDATINAATQSLAGILTATDKTKLDGIASGATANAGTVTSIATSGAILGGTITNTGTISHSTADGYLHVPATGTTNTGKVLTAGDTPGSLSWTTIQSSTVSSVAGRTGDVVIAISDVTGLQTALNDKATATSVSTLSNNIGATTTDYVAVFNAALV